MYFTSGFEPSPLYTRTSPVIRVEALVRLGSTERKIVAVLSDGGPRTRRQIVEETGLTDKAVGSALYRLWKRRVVLRTEKPLREADRVFKGRGGVSPHLRSYNLYVLRPQGKGSIRIEGRRFVERKRKEGAKVSKAQLIMNFLEENSDRAFYSTEVYEALKDRGAQQSDVMSTVRRYEKKGVVYVRGYRTHDGQTPFKEGYLLTWIDPEKRREEVIEEAVQRTDVALAEKSSMSPIVERVHRIRDLVIESTKLRDIISFDFIQNKLGCSQYETEGAIERAMQLYSDVKEVKVFNNFRYYYHNSMSQEDLKAAIAMKENYIRIVKGRANRIGHNWEAVVEFFIDTLTTGAKFRTQAHRNGRMDPRRITIHLLKPIHGRRRNAELDRVWAVTPGPLLNPATYVLECKWGLVRKKDVDEFFDILRWSKEFGVDTPDGRKVKQGVVGVFAGSSFNPKEKVRLKDETKISLASYAARMNIQLLKAADFNEKLRGRGCPRKVTVQKVCKIAKDEDDVRKILEEIWGNPEKSEGILAKTVEKNKNLYEFEKMLEKP